MTKVGRVLTLAAVCLAASGCYHQVIQTGRTPGSTVIHKPWVTTWIFGLVPAQPIDVSRECPNGVATVETQMSFLNGLVNWLIGIVWSPRDVKITCAAGRASIDGLRQINVGVNATSAEKQAALTEAATLSARLNQPVVIRF